jgi:hypothetical protein
MAKENSERKMIPFGIDLNIMELATPLYLEGAS